MSQPADRDRPAGGPEHDLGDRRDAGNGAYFQLYPDDRGVCFETDFELIYRRLSHGRQSG